MRIVLGFSILALGLAATNAANARPVEDRPLPPMAQTTHTPAKLAAVVGVRADLLTTAQLDPFGDAKGALQHRFASSMIDFYPLGGKDGLRVSAGLRYFAVFNFLKDAETASQGLLYGPKFMGGGTAVRTEFNRHTPAVTVGYTATVGHAMVGVEAGSLVGHATANLPHSFSLATNRRAGGMNPIANLVVGLRF